jgi:hypothetical protein
VRRGGEDQIDVRVDQCVRAEPVLVDRDRSRFQPGCRQLRAPGSAARVLDADAPAAASQQGTADERHALGHARGHEHAVRVAGHTADAAEV